MRRLPIVIVTALAAMTLVAACDSSGGGPTLDAVGDMTSPDAADVPGDEAATPDGAAEATEDAPAEEVAPPEAFEPALASALQAVLEDYVTFSGDPGIAFAIRDGDKRAWSGTAGLADVVAGTPVTADSRFRVGSNTKPVTATWILQLVEEGLVDLDAPLTTYLPEYAQWKDVTVRHLLGMQSGIPEYITDFALLAKVLSEPDHVYTPAETLAFVADKPLAYAPGTAGSYSNSNFVLLGMIGEKVTGKKAGDEIRTRILEPLGLDDTYLEQTGDSTEHLVHGYMDLSTLVPLLKMPSAMFAVIPESLDVPSLHAIDATSLMHPSLTWTAGSLVSKPADLAVFQRALNRGELLGPDMLAQMKTFHPVALLGGTVDYGLGLMHQATPLGDIYGHGGLNFGFHVETYYHPGLDVAWCHMHNFLPSQTVAVTDEMIAVYLADGAGANQACELPAGFFPEGSKDDPYVKLVFKGPIGDASKPAEARGGMSSAWLTLGPEWVRLCGLDRVGIYSGAVIAEQIMVGKRLNLTSWGAGDEGDNWLRELMMNADPALFARAGADGTFALTAADGYNASIAIVDIELYPSLKAKKTCVVAVPDYAKPSKVFMCEGAATKIEPGTMLRFAVLGGLTADIAKIDAYLKPLGLARCNCLDESGATIACP